jgi:hypothetical protein
MKSKEEILKSIEREERFIEDKNHPMELDEYANASGWIYALKWVIEEEETFREVLPKKDITHITEGANNDTIKRALKRLSKECGFGRKNNAVNSQNDSIRDGFLYGPQRCTT